MRQDGVIRDRTILCFASGYDAPPTSKHHVMHLLAEDNVVLWVNYHASRTPTASTSDLLYMARKLAQVAGGLRTPRRNLHVLTPLVIPLPSCPLARRLNRRLLLAQLRRALGRVRRGPLQVWSFTPDIGYVLDALSAEKVVYYCVDDHSMFTGYDTERVLEEEQGLCRRADLVVTTSGVLQRAKAPFNERTVRVPHGVDAGHFGRAVFEDLPEPADLAEIPHPRLGFFGLIRDWVDVGLCARIARRRPQWQFVWIGDATFDLAPFRAENMHFLGRRPYDALPAYCRGFDVGLIPFVVNDLTRAVNPIKLREYLAAGLPVVSSPMPEVSQYGDRIEIADGEEAFEAALERALAAGDPAARRVRAESMCEETWPAKLEEICEALHVPSPTA
jgi:glycosyltransferase involved in cell wall biosynthesis